MVQEVMVLLRAPGLGLGLQGLGRAVPSQGSHC